MQIVKAVWNRGLIFSVFFCFLVCAPDTNGAGAAAQPLTIGETFTVSSKILHEDRRINVYLPAGYSAGNARLPVLYMPDGGVAEDFIHVAGLVQVLTGNGTMRPFLLVAIENTERRRDLTGPTANAEDKKIAPRVGGSQNFRKFIREELIPEIEKRYRTTKERAIVGESLAGLFILETFVVEPDLFDTFIAFDPSLWWNDEKLTIETAKRSEQRAGVRKQVFIATSNETGLIAAAERFLKALGESNPNAVQWRYERLPEETHATIYHPAALRAFRALFAPPRQ
jgi:predicted alpha/beta superfamily hydrolase